MLLDYFKRYMKMSRGITDKSVAHYVPGINSINSLLTKYNFPVSDVFKVTILEELENIRIFLQTNEEFLSKDSTGHNMYSVAFKHFYNFTCADHSFFETNIEKMDFASPRPKQVENTQISWKRNQIIITQSIDGANHLCEHNSAHITFTAQATGKQYMEGHHLIPLSLQRLFENNLDTYANVICLCPLCHRLLHHGLAKEKAYVAEEIFERRNDRLCKSGIDISKTEFKKLICP